MSPGGKSRPRRLGKACPNERLPGTVPAWGLYYEGTYGGAFFPLGIQVNGPRAQPVNNRPAAFSRSFRGQFDGANPVSDARALNG